MRLHINGEIGKYINPKYDLLSQSAACVFFCLFFIQLFRIGGRKRTHDHTRHHGCGHHHNDAGSTGKKIISYSILVFPLLTGFLLPPQTLGASIAAKKGTVLSSNAAETHVQTDPNIAVDRKEIKQSEYDENMDRLEHDPVIHMKDDVFEPYYGRISTETQNYVGRIVKMTGFVYKEDGFESNQLALTRFLITHCIADAASIGFLTEFDEASTVKQDTWLEIEGTVELTQYEGTEMPILNVTSWKIIAEPKEPYVYPVYIKII